ncbi:hypothetical protein MMC09_000520 [Bachmanniomyces sp. S44760]|nr:hypothetical protein [Bachmanniomyces sp. S44760]
MSTPSAGPIKSLWFKWKSLKLPWRRRWLAGSDLLGNTYWEFKDTVNSTKLRRIVQYASGTHYGDVQVTPQWHQWLRHTRSTPPTLFEQSSDLQRQSQLKQLAAAADARWAAKPSFLDGPKVSQPGPATLPRDPGGYVGQTEPDEKEGVRSAVGGGVEEVKAGMDRVEDLRDSQRGRAVAGVRDAGGNGESAESKPKEAKKREKNPWDNNTGGPSEGWQPKAWTPGSARR